MDLISKKDLLDQTKISYGQLYRWKREGLIPEEWFIKQAAHTGQETFFPKEQILERIGSILKMKDSYSLEQLAALLSPQGHATIRTKDLCEITEIDSSILAELHPAAETIEIAQAAYLASVCALEISREKKKDLIQKGLPALGEISSGEIYYCVFQDEKNIHVVFLKGKPSLYFDSDIQQVKSVLLDELIWKMKHQYNYLLIQGGKQHE